MPLEVGNSRFAVSRNIAAERAAGKPEKQAVAIAINKARGDGGPGSGPQPGGGHKAKAREHAQKAYDLAKRRGESDEQAYKTAKMVHDRVLSDLSRGDETITTEELGRLKADSGDAPMTTDCMPDAVKLDAARSMMDAVCERLDGLETRLAARRVADASGIDWDNFDRAAQNFGKELAAKNLTTKQAREKVKEYCSKRYDFPSSHIENLIMLTYRQNKNTKADGKSHHTPDPEDREREKRKAEVKRGGKREVREDAYRLYEEKEEIGGPDGPFVRYRVTSANFESLKKQLRSEGYRIVYSNSIGSNLMMLNAKKTKPK